jgi:putative ABC transport system permease protein
MTAVFLRRALRAFAPLVAMVAVVTVGLALAAAAIPRSVDGFLDDALHYDAAGATAISRDASSLGDGAITGGAGEGAGMSEGASGFWGLLDDQLDELHELQPQPLRGALGRAAYTVVTAPEPVSISLPNSVSLGYDPRFFGRVTMVEGAEPAPGPSTVAGGEPIEVVASTAVADALAWTVGGKYTMYLQYGFEQPVILSGLFEPKNADDPYWEHTTAALVPTVDSRILPATINGTVFANAAGFGALRHSLTDVPAPFTARSSIWYPIAPETIDSATTGELAQQLRKLASAGQRVSAAGESALLFRSNLPELLEEATARSSSSQAVLATILAGPIGLAVAIEALVARLAAARLRESLALLRARGASATQRRLLLALPALAVGVLASGIGLVAALLLPGGDLGAGGVVAVVATALAPAALLVATGAGPERAVPGRSGLLRLVAEAVIVLAALASIASAVQRGNGETTGSSVDLISAAVPLTLSLLGCVLTLRLYPVLLRRSLAASHRSRGIAAFLGTARALRAGSAGLVPVLAVLIGVSVAVFSGVLSATLVAGTQTAAESRVGADLAVDNVRLGPDELDTLRDIDGVAVAAGISSDVFHRLRPADVSQFPVTLVLVDPDDFAAAQRGVPGALELPDLDAADNGPVPLAVSIGVDAVTAGETEAELDFAAVTIVGSPLAGAFFNTSQNWVIGDIANAEALDYPSPVVTNQVLVKLSPGASVDRVRSDIARVTGADAEFSTPADVVAERSANPAVGGIRTAVVLAILGAGLLSATALALTTVLDGRSRRASLTLLATLGLGRRQARRTVAWELAPLSAVGLVVGVLLGAALSAITLATVNLRPFTAGTDQPAVVVDPLLMLAIVGGFVLLLATTVVAGAWQATRPARARAAASTASENTASENTVSENTGWES